MMKNRTLHIVFLSMLLCACSTDPLTESSVKDNVHAVSSQMEPLAVLPSVLPDYATKALVTNDVQQSFSANFLRIDEDVDDSDAGLYTYAGGKSAYAGKVNWENAYLVEASVSSAFSSKDGVAKRSVFLNPVQIYKYKVTEEGDKKDTAFYHTRMVSWHPQTCVLHKNDQGTAAVTKFSDFNSGTGGNTYANESDGTVSVIFTGLNGEKDVMVSNVKEAQHWHREDMHQGDDGNYLYNTYRSPFGTHGSYENYFTYKHYLSAVKVYAKASGSEQLTQMWGKIEKVIVKNQPTQMKVTLPYEVSENQTSEASFGTPEFDKYGDFDLVKTAMKGEYEENPEIPEEHPVIKEGETIYLGYALIQPDEDLNLEVHTESGVFDIAVSNEYVAPDAAAGTPATEVFKAGYIYRLEIDFQTEGAIAELVMNEAGNNYYDLSKGELHPSEDEAGNPTQIHEFKYANCYVIHGGIKKEDGSFYDGYAFSATVVGNGESGIYPGFDRTDVHIDPVRAGLLWESSEGLITQVELKYGYVRFKAKNPEAGGPEGNAVIAVYDSKREVLWSWHIWITDTPEDKVFTDGSTSFTLLDRNLGATAANGVLETYGLYYQWGRKDPSMGPSSYDYSPMSTATASYWDYYGDEWNSAGVVILPESTVAESVKNPMYLLLPSGVNVQSYQYDWLSDNIDYLWGDYSRDANARLKTIYDPCPFGYMVPQDEITTVFAAAQAADNGYTVGPYGMTVENGDDDLFFPFAGYKGVDKGVSSLTCAWKYVGEKGDYMSSKIDLGGHRSRTYISSDPTWTETGADVNGDDGIGDEKCQYYDHVYPDNYANRRVAASVRCVKRSKALNASISANLWSDTVGYDITTSSTEIKVKLNYSITSNQSPINSVTFSDNSGSDVSPGEEVVGKTTVSGSIEFTYPAPSTGSRRYSMTVTNRKGVKTTKWFTVYFLNIGDITVKDESGNESSSYDYGKEYTISATVNGLDDACTVMINGVTSTKGEDNAYTAEALISGHVVVQVLDTFGKLICEKVYACNMNEESINSFKLGDRIYFSTELESGGMYIIRPYNNNIDYYWNVSGAGALQMTQITLPQTAAFGKEYVFIYHKDDTKGSISGYYSVTAGAWKSLSAGKFMDSDFEFTITDHTDAAYVTVANNWGNSQENDNVDFYLGSTGQTMYYNSSYNNSITSFGWTSSVGSKDGYRKWVIYKAEPDTQR